MEEEFIIQKLNYKKALQNQGFCSIQSLSDFGTAASRMLSEFEDFEVVKMQRLGKRTVLHSLL